MRARACQLAIGRRWKAASLRPFLQYSLWIAQRTKRLEHPLFPETLDQSVGRFVTAVDEHRAHQRLADIGKNCRASPAAGVRLRIAELQRRTEIHCPRNLGAGFLAHQIGQTPRELSLVRSWKSAIEHVRDDKAKNVIAEEFKPLIAGRTIAPRQRGDVRQGALK